MAKRATTRLSSKGQVVLPAWVREKLRLAPGDELVVSVEPAEPDRVVLTRRLDPDEVETMLEPAYAWVRETGRDLVEEFHAARGQARVRERARRRP
jgi:AbrB family looped-hinge helix DNA binding protein